MSSELEQNLISGGISAAAAKVISNALANLATGRTYSGRQLTDNTPVSRMRLIDGDTRKYVLTNLDYQKDNPYQKSGTQPSRDPIQPSDHPYKDSQPATATPTPSTPTVKAGKFIQVATTTTNNVAQAEVTLKLVSKGGTHARLNSATGEI